MQRVCALCRTRLLSRTLPATRAALPSTSSLHTASSSTSAPSSHALQPSRGLRTAATLPYTPLHTAAHRPTATRRSPVAVLSPQPLQRRGIACPAEPPANPPEDFEPVEEELAEGETLEMHLTDAAIKVRFSLGYATAGGAASLVVRARMMCYERSAGWYLPLTSLPLPAANRAGATGGEGRQARAPASGRERRLPRLPIQDAGDEQAGRRRLVRPAPLLHSISFEANPLLRCPSRRSLFRPPTDTHAALIVDSASLPLVKGSTIDYSTELIGSAFKIRNNPQSKDAGCGCGVSESCSCRHYCVAGPTKSVSLVLPRRSRRLNPLTLLYSTGWELKDI